MSDTRQELLDEITARVSENFRTFGGGRKACWGNPLDAAFAKQPYAFALGVDVRQVVEFVANELEASRESCS